MIKLGKNFEIDLDKLISTRMLIQANSGGGKSYAIRKLLEESHGQVQQIVIDLEGEFSSLREKYDYLLVGQDGEIPARIQTAELLARKLLKLNVSTIIDLSELKHHERILFVKRFLNSLVNAPKDLWHPCMVVVDEAHQFCPEKSKSESMNAVIDLMTRGRKRGFCGVLATQRISKLHKDAAAECNNQMVGRTGQDIDQKRAGDILGLATKADIRNLRNLEDGEFWVFGPAIGRDVKKVEVGLTKTIHMNSKNVLSSPTPTPKNIEKLLKDVIDLPKEADEELKTTQDMKNKIRELKTKLTILEKTKPKPELDKLTIDKFKTQGHKEAEIIFYKTAKEYEKQINVLQKKIIDIGRITGQEVKPITIPELKKHHGIPENTITTNAYTRPGKQSISKILEKEYTPTQENKPRAGAMKILGWLAGAYPNTLTRQRVATLSGFSIKGGTFAVYTGQLKRNGFIEGVKELSATEEGLKISEPTEIPSGEELLRLWKGKVKKGAGEMLQFLFESYPEKVSREELGDATGFSPTGGTFAVYIGELRRNGLIKINEGIKISDEFFE